jgi:Terpene synthase family 2, C-terminal metal binding
MHWQLVNNDSAVRAGSLKELEPIATDGLAVPWPDNTVEPGCGKDVRVELQYPVEWFAPVRLSAYAETIGIQTIEWLGTLGLIRDDASMKHVIAMEPEHYAGYSHPMADSDHALLYCKYITLWLLWDDVVVERTSCAADVMVPLDALGGSFCNPSDPYCVGFWQIGEGYEARGASRAWRRRFANVMREWARYATEEEAVRRASLDVLTPGRFFAALRRRSYTVGIRPNSIPLERAVGFELPAEILADMAYAELLDNAAQICCLMNDLVGMQKDVANGQEGSNMVLLYRKCFNVSLGEACAKIVEIHDRAVREFDRAAIRLLSRCPSNYVERLSVFIAQLRYMDTGFAFWHRDCARYHQGRSLTELGDTALVIGQRSEGT